MTYQEYFKSKYPEEAVGYIKNGEFFPLENIASEVCDEKGKVLFDKTNSFEVDPIFLLEEPDLLIHSHTKAPARGIHPLTPSKSDLAGQVATDIEWAIVSTDGEKVSEPIYWGSPTHRPPLEGRRFIFNMYDCFSLLQDFLFKEKGYELPQVVRDPFWHARGDNFIDDLHVRYGFTKIPLDKLQYGDALFCAIGTSPVVRHIGIYLGDDKVLSHFYKKRSRVYPLAELIETVKYAARHKCFE
jgi:cell wall-associated NlpC family hydrolase